MRDLSFATPRGEDNPRASERLGQPSRGRPPGYLLWLHAETTDEAAAAPALGQELSRTRGEAFHVLVTTVENGPLGVSSGDRTIHQLAPGETSGSVARFLDYWTPDAGIVMGIPDRPNLIHAAHARRIPLYLASSKRGSLAARRRLSYLSGELLKHFDLCLAASAADAEVLHRHLDNDIRVEVLGPLSDTTQALPCSDTERDQTAQRLRGRPVWLAADVTLSEIDIVEEAHRRAFRFAHRLLLVIIPKDLSTAGPIAARLREKGWEVGLSSADQLVEDAIQIHVADGGEEHGLWYRLAPIAFIGGTMDADAFPADPYAPAALGSAVLHGPHLGPSTARFDRLSEAEACLRVDSADQLGQAVQRLLAPDKAAEMAQAGWRVTTESAHVVDRLVELINESLDLREAR